jgi:hypothetical protein
VLNLDLTDEEVEVLRHVLESYLSDLRMEIADTDLLDFRNMLKDRKGVIRKVLEAMPVASEAVE